MTEETSLPDYGEFARMLYATCIISDPWIAGKERFRLQGIVLPQAQADQLQLAAERIGFLYHEVAEIVAQNPTLLDEFFQLTPYQKAMWLQAEGRWHGIARVDLFLCSDGSIKSCEMNSDTPSGEAEATILNQLLHPYHPNTTDPNANFAEDFWQMLVQSDQATRGPQAELKTIAIIYPTDLPEDLSMIAVYKRWLENHHCNVVIGSPYNLSLDPHGNLLVMGTKVDLVIRHYKTDWWGERETIWNNQQEFPDAQPLDHELSTILTAEYGNRVTVVNPFGAVVTQNKCAMALMWERQELFSERAQEWIRAYIPETYRFDSISPATLPREEWVLKSVYGCEGDSVIVGKFTKPNDWQLALTSAIPRHWIFQKYFDVAPVDDYLPNIGVYLIGGKASGFYSRLAAKSTDYTAITAPTFIANH